MTIKRNCGCGGGTAKCGCSGREIGDRTATRVRHSFKIEGLRSSDLRHETFNKRSTLIVPVIMAKSGLPMNGGLIPDEEFIPEAWNGRPVVLSHPVDTEGYVSANSPEVLENVQIGQLFNTQFDGVSFKSEAWLDVKKTDEVYPGLIAQLRRGDSQIDVSVGYYSKDFESQGISADRAYYVIHRDLQPDHLAILPDEEGACNWENGCGIRSNRNKGVSPMAFDKKVKSALDTVFKAFGIKTASEVEEKDIQTLLKRLRTHERGENDDPRQIMADLISNEASPFLPDDQGSLEMMSGDTLRKMRDTFIPKAEEVVVIDPEEEEEPSLEEEADPDQTKDPEAMADGEDDKKDPETMKTHKDKVDVEALVAKAVDAAVDKAVSTVIRKFSAQSKNGLSAEDKAALLQVRKMAEEHRGELVAHIKACSSLPDDFLKAQSTAQLEVLAAGLHPAPNYSAAAARTVAVEDEDEGAMAMLPSSTVSILQARNRKVERAA